jgi:putative membrane protein
MFTLTDLRVLVISVIYAGLGMVLLYVGYRLFDWLTPTHNQDVIFKDRNVAVGIVVGSFILGLAFIIGAAIHG